MKRFFEFLTLNIDSNFNGPAWNILTSFSSLLLSISIAKCSNWQLGLFFFYLMLSSINHGVYKFASVECPFSRLGALHTLAVTVFIGLIFVQFEKAWIELVFAYLPHLLIFNFIFHMIPRPWKRAKNLSGTTNPIFGIGGNTSIDSSLSALICAIMLTMTYSPFLKEIAVACTFVIIIKNRATAGALALLASLLMFLLFNGYHFVSATIFVLSAIILIIRRKTLLSSSGRIEMWRFVWKNLVWRETMWFGIGNGRLKIVLPSEQNRLIPNEKNFWKHLHNDLYELFVATGIVGVVLLINLIVGAVPEFHQREWIIISAIIPNVLFNFPFRLAKDTFLMILALKYFFLTR